MEELSSVVGLTIVITELHNGAIKLESKKSDVHIWFFLNVFCKKKNEGRDLTSFNVQYAFWQTTGLGESKGEFRRVTKSQRYCW